MKNQFRQNTHLLILNDYYVHDDNRVYTWSIFLLVNEKTCIKADCKRRISFSYSFSPVWQNLPVYMQVLHTHVAVVPTGTQVPPFWHGFESTHGNKVPGKKPTKKHCMYEWIGGTKNDNLNSNLMIFPVYKNCSLSLSIYYTII